MTGAPRPPEPPRPGEPLGFSIPGGAGMLRGVIPILLGGVGLGIAIYHEQMPGMIIGGLLIAFGLVVILFSVRIYRKHVRIWRSGEISRGDVTRSWAGSTAGGSSWGGSASPSWYAEVHYHADGKRYAIEVETATDWRDETVWAAYDPKNPAYGVPTLVRESWTSRRPPAGDRMSRYRYSA